jgi:predicted MFS family arabinose efflux permease
LLALLLFAVSEVLESVPLAQKLPAGDGSEIPIQRLRPIIFAAFIAYNLSVGFLPNYALKIGGSFMGLPSGLSAAMPIASCDVMLAVSPLFTPYLISRMGYRLSFSAGAALCIAGYAAAAMAASISPLVAGMGALGLGSGILFVITQTCAASRRSADDRALGFSSFAAASFSGVNCGIMTGGVIATHFGQKSVFSFGAILMVFIMAAFLFLTRKYANALLRPGDGAVNRAEKRALFQRGVVAFLCLSFLPFTMYSGFMYYLVPVFGSQSGFSDTEVSMVFVLFGVGLTYLGPRIASFVLGRETRISHFLRLALIMELAGILYFAVLQSTSSMLAAVLILGVASGIGNTYFPLYLTEMPEAKGLRDGADIALFNFTENLGFAAAPMIFSAILHSGASSWYYALAASMLLSSLLYGAVRRNERS